MVKLFNEDCLELLKQGSENSIDAIITDPPYGIKFMNKKWDIECPSIELWKECLRVLKPGGHLMSFSGTRTIDFIMGRIREAGFEIRDTVTWLYGSGFPKSHNISKGIDKKAGAEREIIGKNKNPLSTTKNNFNKFLENRDIRQQKKIINNLNITAPSTNLAKQWDGWGTALKPVCEFIIMARKPFKGSVADNVLKHGTGAINIDECRVTAGEDHAKNCNRKEVESHWRLNNSPKKEVHAHSQGRWPANLILSHHPECERVGVKEVKGSNDPRKSGGVLNSAGIFGVGEKKREVANFNNPNGKETVEDWKCHEDCAVKMLDEQSGDLGKSAGGNNRAIQKNCYNDYGKNYNNTSSGIKCGFGDKGGASRFFKNIQGDLCKNVNTVKSTLSLQNQVEDFVLKLVAIEDNHEDKLLSDSIQPFMNAIRNQLKQNSEKNIKMIPTIGKKCLHGLQRIIMEKSFVSPAKYADAQKQINTIIIIQSLINIDGFVDHVMSNTMLRNMALGEKVSRFKYQAKASKSERNKGLEGMPEKSEGIGDPRPSGQSMQRLDGRAERKMQNHHPTVKPLKLMEYLVKLVTPPGGTVLDPFMGSGSTGIACSGFNFIGVEINKEYFEIAKRRLNEVD